MSARLSSLQSEVLAILAGIEPAWTLTGGAALAGFHLGHRTTRDLDLFWHGARSVESVSRDVVARLESAGLAVQSLRSTPGFCALSVRDDSESVLVDLVAEPVRFVEMPAWIEHRGVRIQVDTPHEILVNKLCALLHRSEIRDLVDIAALLSTGGDLERALADAPKKDGGFSGVALGWAMNGWALADAARAGGYGERVEELERLRGELMRKAAGRGP